MPDGRSLLDITRDLNEKREELEADMQAIANDALYEGRFVVAPFPEGLQLCWLTCEGDASCPTCCPPRNQKRSQRRR